jgi:hypothetical protein
MFIPDPGVEKAPHLGSGSATLVGDPDPHVFGPPGSESEVRGTRVRIRILPFSHKKDVERTEKMLAKLYFNTTASKDKVSITCYCKLRNKDTNTY